ncbi:hypothetical protein ACLKA6_004024 [Drosophila palustris]
MAVTAVTKTLTAAAVAMASSMDNNTVYSYDIAASDVLYQWSAAAASGARVVAAATTTDPLPTASSYVSASASASASTVERVPGLMEASPGSFNDSHFMFVDYARSLNDSLDYSSHQQHLNSSGCSAENNISYWNITCDSPLDYAMPLYGYCMPFLLFMTIISNSLIVLVLSKKSMATPTNFVLMGRSFSEISKIAGNVRGTFRVALGFSSDPGIPRATTQVMPRYSNSVCNANG